MWADMTWGEIFGGTFEIYVTEYNLTTDTAGKGIFRVVNELMVLS